jgi:hypothetical protein
VLRENSFSLKSLEISAVARIAWRSGSFCIRPRPEASTALRNDIALIPRISGQHPEWGEDWVAEELAVKLGVRHSTSTIGRYGATAGAAGRADLEDLHQDCEVPRR